MGSETIVIEEMKIYEEKPPYWPLFLFAGFMLIGIAIANIILCLDYHAFFFIWSGVLVIIFSIMCIIHGGDYYDSKWKSFLLIIIGFITNVFILAALFLVIKTFTYQCIEIIQFRPDFYITILTFRYQYLNQTPIVTINNEFAYNAWVCFGIDGLGIIFLFVCLGTLTTTLFVIDRFYNSHYVINRKIEPGCEPKLFNPYSQCNLGQVILVVGMVVTGLDDGVSDNASFFYKYPLIWTGAVPIVAGLFAAITLKNCSITHRVVAIIAIILELISLLSSIAAAILTALVIVENITTLIATSFKLVTLFSVNLILSSAILETASLIVVVINVIYSLSLLFRIVACICTKWYHTDENEEKKLVTEDGSSNVSSTVIVDKTPAAVQPAAAQSSNEFARFDPYRSYYVK